MKAYLKSIIPNLFGIGERLDKMSLLLNHPWVLTNHPKGNVKYIFQKGGEMIISQKGQVTKGKWELLKEARSLFIEYDSTKLLLNQHFLDPAVLLFKQDGSDENIFALINENIIPDLDLEKYLLSLFHKKHNAVQKINVIEGGSLQVGLKKANDFAGIPGQKVLLNSEFVDHGVFHSESTGYRYYIKNSQIIRRKRIIKYNLENGNILEVEVPVTEKTARYGGLAFIRGEPATNNRYEIKNSKEIFEVKDGKILRILFRRKYKLKSGEFLSIITTSYTGYNKNDEVYLNNEPAPDGLYKLAFLHKIKVKNGRLVWILNW